MSYFKKVFYIVSLSLLMLNASHAREYWGAVYYNKQNGIAGGSYNYKSEVGAKQSALESCISKHNGKHANCVFVVSIQSSCVAAYWSPVNNAGSWASDANSLVRAENSAYKACSNRGENCKLIISFCTDRPAYY